MCRRTSFFHATMKRRDGSLSHFCLKKRLAQLFRFMYNPFHGLTKGSVYSHGADLLKPAAIAAKYEFPNA